MVKKMVSRLLVLAVLIVFMAACSKKSEYTNIIPADASAVASIDLKSLADKAGLNDKENAAMKQKMMDAFKNGMNAATFQQLEKVINNPTESGIDVKSVVYFFTSPTLPYASLVANIDNEDKLITSLDVMAKEQVCQPVTDGDGYKFTTMNGNLLAFNASAVIIVNMQSESQAEEIKKTISNLMKQTSENSISKSGAFQKMQKQKGDIKFFASMTAIPEEYARQLSTSLPSQINLKDLSILGDLSFEKGKIAAKFENYTDNEEVKELLKKQQKAIGKVNSTFLNYFPVSTLAFMNIGVNGSELYNILLDNQEFRNTVSIAKAAEVKELFSSFNGDISAGLINVTMNNAPNFVAYADVKNGNALKAIYTNKKALGLKQGEDILQLGTDEYVYKSRSMNVFFGIKNKQMYATNDELLYKSIGKNVDKSVKDASYASDMKGKSFFLAINMDSILELPVVKMVMGFGGEEAKMYVNLVSQVSYLSVSSEGEVSEIDLSLKNKDVNALKQIVDFAKQFAGM